MTDTYEAFPDSEFSEYVSRKYQRFPIVDRAIVAEDPAPADNEEGELCD